jgi:hypothetical protein
VKRLRDHLIFYSAIAAFVELSLPAAACSACFGKSDSSMAVGMNWGIFSLLGVIVSVLGSVAGFFVYLARKSAAFNAANRAGVTTGTPVESAQVDKERETELVGASD